MQHALVIGGSNGIGLAITSLLSKSCEQITVIDKCVPDIVLPKNVSYVQENLTLTDFSFLTRFQEIDTLIYSAGFGRVSPYESILPIEIDNSFKVNTIGCMKIVNFFFDRMKKNSDFHCAILVSIAGRISSPLFSLYSATKAALSKAIEAWNIELEVSGSANRILEVSPGSIKGTRFSGRGNDLTQTTVLAEKIVQNMNMHKTLFIPDYTTVYKTVIDRYITDAHQFGLDSYHYKTARINPNPQMIVGYLSGTFDLFHIGHLNLLRRAKQFCDYLVVGVHRDASHKGKETFISFEERCDIVRNIKFVDKVIESEKEDSDVYTKGIVKYDILFVGSDYKGTERFNRYEKYFATRNVRIIYFPYTQGTSSTQLRKAIEE